VKSTPDCTRTHTGIFTHSCVNRYNAWRKGKLLGGS
jgi:hypothetical protein